MMITSIEKCNPSIAEKLLKEMEKEAEVILTMS